MPDILEADRRLYLLLHNRFHTPWLDDIMVWLTKAGTKGVVWLGLAVGLFIDGSPHARWVAALTVAALLLAEGLINIVLKPAVRRERPFVSHGLARLLVKVPGPHSWPSAHAGSSMAAALVLAYAYHWWGILFLVAALLVGYSRVYVGVHYPLDVLAGILVGVVSAAAVVVAAELITPLIHTPPVAALAMNWLTS